MAFCIASAYYLVCEWHFALLRHFVLLLLIMKKKLLTKIIDRRSKINVLAQGFSNFFVL